MKISKEELVCRIEAAREALNSSIEKKEEYGSIYQNSIELDKLIELYIVSGF